MNGRLRIAVTVLVLGAQSAGQETVGSQPLLRVASNDVRWMEAFAQPFGLTLPALPAGKQLQLLVPSKGEARVEASADPFPVRTLVVDVRAAAWLQQEAEAAGTAERQLTTRVEGFAKLAGFPGEPAREICREVGHLLRSLESANAVITQVDAGRRYDIRLELVPMPESAFARWLRGITAAATSRPQLAWSDAALRLDLALARDCFANACAPFLPLVAAVGIHRRDPRAAEDEMRALLPLLDGSLQLILAPGRLGFVYGLHDGEAFAARTLDPERLRKDAEALAGQGIEAEFAPAALSHRNTPMLRSRVRSRHPLPGLGNDDGDLVSFGARVGNLWLQIGGGVEPQVSMKAAIDDALDGRLRGPSAASSESPAAAWLTCEVELDRLGSMLASTNDAAAAHGSEPARLSVSLRSSPQSLKALIQLR